ncbi:endopeptidase La [Ectopseudomonas hydrolytica]|jgi:ATP-dependent Lon protease|uniref:Lon protease n=1 Tax=Ectopseudomonas mendocina (strain ymp) TaxID=399739 RepID=A4XRM2_ECTM1|nr:MULTISPECIES: endopeptidase La [Pseudomonas]ARS47992.1 Lon protease [Pseudomonas mendocina]ATH83258.1 endopeptidase La [Pseudomonas mendocina]MBF8163499.1 endopeptidase La [Pseudomonas mendocina]UTH32890.1 endopeptidase La [Pseudomonas hydrolytica]UTH37736.1 endopeptidase La [Pseudomonas sp. KHPS1]
MNDQDINSEAVEDKVQVGSTGLVLPAQQLPDKLYVIPIHNRPFFPAQVLPVIVNQHPWGRTLNRVGNTEHKCLAVFYVDNPPDENGEFDLASLPEHGTLVRVHHVSEEGGKLQFVAQGLTRVRIRGWLSRRGPYLAEVDYPQAPSDPRDEVKAYGMALINAIKELLPLNPLYSEELKNYLNRFSPNEPSPLTDFAAALTTAPGHELQEVLDCVPILKRMEKVLPLLRKEVEVGRLQKELSAEVNRQIGERQREFFLKEQLKLIQQELGISKDDKSADREEFLARLEGKTLPAPVRKRIDEELNKLSILETGSPEYAVTRNYLDWATALPWGIHGQDKLDLGRARKVLDKHHAGMDDIKRRITEFLAVGAFKGEIAGSIVLLVGPPGVGKTSIGKSIAESLGRPFYRFSVGGMRDEAEIKGHRRTYIGAMPGKLVQALKEAEVMNPVIMLDEIDKMGTSYQGDPASALLETLDPEQNVEFLDHYLDLRLDLSKVLFVCTANTLDSIPGPLLDRMEVIRLSGYITEEKLAIAKRHLWPKQLEKAGVPKARLSISDAALRAVIEGYAREAGVRQLEKQLGKLVRKSVVRLLEDPEAKIRIGAKDLEEALGMPVFRNERVLAGVGVITGLAWTSMGGATLPIEATRIHTLNRGFKLTGQLGEVMKESAEIAYSYVSSHLKQFGGDPTFFDQAFVHLHVPEGATPKDGPSAGITMASALLSLARNQAPKKGVAMTGELTLTGQVLPIGGVREKVIAARRQKIHELILPEANRGSYEELPDYLKEGLTVHFARRYGDVARVLFD